MRILCRRNRPEGPGWAAGGLSPEPQGTLPALSLSRVFPRGLPDEFALVLTLLLKRHTHQNTWYLFQVTDGDGYPQVSPIPTLIALGALSSAQAWDFWTSLLHASAPSQGHPYPSNTDLILSGCAAL